MTEPWKDDYYRLEGKIDNLNRENAEQGLNIKRVEDRLDKGASLTAAKALEKAHEAADKVKDIEHKVDKAKDAYEFDKKELKTLMDYELQTIRGELSHESSWKGRASYIIWTVAITAIVSTVVTLAATKGFNAIMEKPETTRRK